MQRLRERSQGQAATPQRIARAPCPETWRQKRAPRRGQPAFRGGAMAGTSSSGSHSKGASTCSRRMRIIGSSDRVSDAAHLRVEMKDSQS